MPRIPGSNIFTVDIAKTLNLPLGEALKVQSFMDENQCVDWSEDSARKIKQETIMAWRVMNSI
jgi:hypothetical protein